MPALRGGRATRACGVVELSYLLQHGHPGFLHDIPGGVAAAGQPPRVPPQPALPAADEQVAGLALAFLATQDEQLVDHSLAGVVHAFRLMV
jgi:hypothetical protein